MKPQDDLAEAVRGVRDRLGLTQQELAGRLGVALPTVSRWENGRHRPSKLALAKIEGLLDEMGEEGHDLLDQYFNKKARDKG